MRYRLGPLLLSMLLLVTACGSGSNSNGDAADGGGAEPVSDDVRAVEDRIAEAAEGAHRSEAHIARNAQRRPVETLSFFGLRPDMTVVEVWPGGGWYTEVLAPVLRDEGRLIAASYPLDGRMLFRVQMTRDYRAKLAQYPELYRAVEHMPFLPPTHGDLGAPGTADMVLLSRHFHNFIAAGITEPVLEAAYAVLRPGGILAVVQHRAAESSVPESEQRDGYVRESFVIEQAEQAGFQLDARSEINANPKDTRDHAAGVWALPPSLRACQSIEDADERARCEEKYRAIGESDRMTLRFIKPS
ncbi:class I SAM-dependent methyltransferase [Algiphilus sp.]|uniref:class I SAM-dependent methyltransferase n=1 Tax=Algiphilus sp. TaxID=1872431 RepID=UPI003B52A7DD